MHLLVISKHCNVYFVGKLRWQTKKVTHVQNTFTKTVLAWQTATVL
jgi:hypothetical protein